MTRSPSEWLLLAFLVGAAGLAVVVGEAGGSPALEYRGRAAIFLVSTAAFALTVFLWRPESVNLWIVFLFSVLFSAADRIVRLGALGEGALWGDALQIEGERHRHRRNRARGRSAPAPRPAGGTDALRPADLPTEAGRRRSQAPGGMTRVSLASRAVAGVARQTLGGAGGGRLARTSRTPRLPPHPVLRAAVPGAVAPSGRGPDRLLLLGRKRSRVPRPRVWADRGLGLDLLDGYRARMRAPAPRARAWAAGSGADRTGTSSARYGTGGTTSCGSTATTTRPLAGRGRREARGRLDPDPRGPDAAPRAPVASTPAEARRPSQPVQSGGRALCGRAEPASLRSLRHAAGPSLPGAALRRQRGVPRPRRDLRPQASPGPGQLR